jgi:hypothetical protein
VLTRYWLSAGSRFQALPAFLCSWAALLLLALLSNSVHHTGTLVTPARPPNEMQLQLCNWPVEGHADAVGMAMIAKNARDAGLCMNYTLEHATYNILYAVRSCM